MAPRGRPKQFDAPEVLDRALRLFWRHGFDGVSTDEICRDTGLSKPSLYNAFGDKEDLYIRCLDAYNQTYAGRLIAILEKYPDPVVGVEKMFTATAKQFRDPDFPAGCLALTGMVEVVGKSEKIDRHLRRVQQQFLAAFETYFSALPTKPRVPTKLIAQYLVAQLYALAMFSKTNPDLFDFRGFVKSVRTAVAAFF